MEEKEKHWSKFASDFEERNNYVVGKSDMQIILSEVANLRGIGNTLELACRAGTYSKILGKHASHLLATDFSDEMVAVAKKELKDYSNIKCEKANAFKLPYKNESFDTIFMANLLHIIPNPEDVLKESKRLLKNEGIIIILDIGMEGIKFIHAIKMMYRYFKTHGKPPSKGKKLHVKLLKEMLTKEGFKLVHAKLIGEKIKAAYVIASKKQI